MTCSQCPDWRLRCIFIGCPEMNERLSRIDEDIDYRQEYIRGAMRREMDERIERYLGRRRI
jgi:hypothetical protein